MGEASHSYRRTAFRLIGELLAISVGVFIGLAADAAWDERQERGREADYLASLRLEMELASEELLVDHERRRRISDAADSILSELDRRSLPDSSLNKWIQDVGMRMTRFFPPSAVLDDLVSSGNLSVLSSDELRFALLEYQQNRERLWFLEDYERAADEDGMRPYLTAKFRWPDDMSFLTTPVTRPIPVPEREWNALLADPVFRNLVSIKRARLRLVQARSAELADLLDRIVGLIDAILARADDS